MQDAATNEPLTGVTITLKQHAAIGTTTDAAGLAVLDGEGVPAGRDTLLISDIGYKNAVLITTLPDTTLHKILLVADERSLSEVVVVASTRSNDRIENATTKVEVIGQEDLNEESTLKPGNVASILGDVSGVQIQQSSAVSGNANIRIQGLDGRYTQMLRDGMPLYEGFSGGFGVLSIPPLDLKQIELIKGSSSTLYGGGAIAGLVNFISKRPADEPDASFVLNGSTLKEGNLNAYYAKRWKGIGLTFFAGQTVQHEADVDGDGLSDVPRLRSTLIHPTLFFYPTNKSSISVGWSGSFEKRTGGDMQAIANNSDTAHPYFETNRLNRNTFTLIAENKFSNSVSGTVKGTFSDFSRGITTNTYDFNGTQQNYYAEASLVARLQRHTLIGGINVTGDHFHPSDATPVMVGSIVNDVSGVFLQDTWQLPEGTKIEGGLRVDYHQRYGAFVLPRLAVFHRFDKHWGARGGFGLGYETPNPLTPQVKDYDITEIHSIAPNAVPERSAGANIEGNYRNEWDKEHTVFINHAFFLTQVNHPYVGTELSDGSLTFYNADKPIVTKGFDTYIQVKLADWEAYLGYTYTDAERKYLAANQFVPLTPRNRAAATLVYEIEGKWRFGLEASYNGAQYRDSDNKTTPYVLMAAMIERKFGPKFSLVLNGENLLDARQTRYEQIYTGAVSAPDFKPVWAPLDGRVINLAIRFKPFAK